MAGWQNGCVSVCVCLCVCVCVCVCVHQQTLNEVFTKTFSENKKKKQLSLLVCWQRYWYERERETDRERKGGEREIIIHNAYYIFSCLSSL